MRATSGPGCVMCSPGSRDDGPAIEIVSGASACTGDATQGVPGARPWRGGGSDWRYGMVSA